MRHIKQIEIAGIKIRVWSKEAPLPDEKKTADRYASFLKEEGSGKVDLDLEVVVADKLPIPKGGKTLFKVARDLQKPVWMLAEKQGEFILYMRMGEPCAVFLNQDFSVGRIQIKPYKRDSSWKMSSIIYGPLQIILMHYLAKHRLGVLVHSAGVNYHGDGFLFVAKTQTGKSTIARLWSQRKDANILNDDRIIVRKVGDKIYLFGTPWHGDFSDYVDTIASSAPLKKLFFIYHLKENRLQPLNALEAFNRFYPNTFPVFWDRKAAEFTFDFLREIIHKVPAFSLGFVKDDRVVEYVLRESTESALSY